MGNRIVVDDGSSIIYDVNCLNQYTAVEPTSYYYDENGNLSDDGTHLYYYDCENRLIDVNDKATSNPVVSYGYDYQGRRVSKTVSSSITKYCYDGDQVIAEYNGDTLLRKFVYGPGIDEPICMIDVSGGNKVYYYHFDGLGSVIALSDVNSVIVERYSYDVFGEPNRISDVNNPYMFTGRRYDGEAGLYYYRARYYDPNIGRFLQTDPIGYDDGLNMYTYVGNNPIVFVDPSGLWQFTTGGAFGLGGRITFGRNNGRWNIGFAFGYGLGAMVEFTPDDIDSGSASEGFSADVGAEVSGQAKIYNVGVAGGLRGRSVADIAGNMETRIGVIGGFGVPHVEAINLSGSGDIVVQGNTSGSDFGIFPELTKNPVSYGLGGMVFGGVTGGIEWGSKCEK